jgi:hypothetical protein
MPIHPYLRRSYWIDKTSGVIHKSRCSSLGRFCVRLTTIRCRKILQTPQNMTDSLQRPKKCLKDIKIATKMAYRTGYGY